MASQQNYRKLKQQCEKAGSLFVDDEFPASNKSLFLDERSTNDIIWKRPGELVDDPHLFVEGPSVTDVRQGILGNCWLVSACSALTHNSHLLEKVIPNVDEQEWSEKKKYAGIFRFCFWQFGEWTDVVIDDLLPTRNDKLIFAQSETSNEFWSALLEKAFAKLYGCYHNLHGGPLADALQDVSGGVPETICIDRFKDIMGENWHFELFKHLNEAFANKALMLAAITPKCKEDIEKRLECGLIKGHVYAVTAVRYMELDAKTPGLFPFAIGGRVIHERKLLIRLQNPWGEKEWNGAWSDKSEEWNNVTKARKAELGITVNEDGEFWMPFDEFCKYFTKISVCQLLNTRTSSSSKRYMETTFFGSWKVNGRSGAPNDRAGGCLEKFSATFCSNPQVNLYHIHSESAPLLYRFDIKDEIENTVMMSLTQKEKRDGKKREPYLTIGLHVMKVEENRKYRVHKAMQKVVTSDYEHSRSIYLSINNLQPGRYVVMPTTYTHQEEGDFMLRLYTSHSPNAHELTEHKPTEGSFDAVMRLTVIVEADQLRADKDKTTNQYFVARSDQDMERSPTIPKTYSPKWNWSVVFYRRTVRQPVELELWDKNILKDTLAGKAIIAFDVENNFDNNCKRVTVKLRDRNGADYSGNLGTLTVEIASYDDPVYL